MTPSRCSQVLPRTFAAFLLALSPGLSAQSLIRSDGATPEPPASDFGTALALLDDLDRDGVREIATIASGGIRIHSGATGAILRHIAPGSGLNPGVTTIAPIDDLDGDGIDDLIAGYPLHGTDGRGAVAVYSVRTGRRLHLFNGTPTSQLGSSIAAIGDTDFDGVPDIAAGAPLRDGSGQTDIGLVNVYSGATGNVLWQASFGGAASRCGETIAALGDPDGDGRVSIAIGSPGARKVYIAEVLGNPALIEFDGSPFAFNAMDGFAEVMLSVPDLDGDGSRDLLIAAPRFAQLQDTTSPVGGVTAKNGATGAPIWFRAGTGSQMLGTDLFEVGDVNGDGVPEIGLGTSGGPGIFELYLASGVDGSPAGPWSSFPAGRRAAVVAEDMDGNGLADIWVGSDGTGLRRLAESSHSADTLLEFTSREGHGYGSVLSVLDDLDGDGVAEVAVGIPHAPGLNFGTGLAGPGSRGRVEIRSQGVLLQTLEGGDTNEEFGHAIEPLDDLDGDGVDDFAVGRPNARFGVATRTGAVTIYSGSDRSVIRHHFGQGFGDRFGASIARVPDANGDGFDDYAIGSPGWSSAGGTIDVGRVQLFSGLNGMQLFLRNGSVASGRFGTAVDGTPDLDGDGRGEVIVGAPFEWTSLSNLFAGRVRCYSGANGSELWAAVGSQANMWLGTSVAAIGDDLTGDGVPDILVGAPNYRVGQAGDGRVELLSGANGSVYWSANGAFDSRLGVAVLATGDLDNDGSVDFVVGEPRAIDLSNSTRPGLTRVYTGRTLDLAFTIPGPRDAGRFASAMASGADFDGDRFDDLLIGDPVTVLGQPEELATWTARAFGTEVSGMGTAGCAGPINLTLVRPAEVGLSMTLRYGELTAGATPVLFVGDFPSTGGIPVLGALLHLNPLFTVELPPMNAAYDSLTLPVTNPALVGVDLSFQMFALWPTVCPVLPFGLASSNALTVTFQ